MSPTKFRIGKKIIAKRNEMKMKNNALDRRTIHLRKVSAKDGFNINNSSCRDFFFASQIKIKKAFEASHKSS